MMRKALLKRLRAQLKEQQCRLSLLDDHRADPSTGSSLQMRKQVEVKIASLQTEIQTLEGELVEEQRKFGPPPQKDKQRFQEYILDQVSLLKGATNDDAYHNLIDLPAAEILLDAFGKETNPYIRSELVEILWHYQLDGKEQIDFLARALADAKRCVWKAALEGMLGALRQDERSRGAILTALNEVLPGIQEHCRRILVAEAINEVKKGASQ